MFKKILIICVLPLCFGSCATQKQTLKNISEKMPNIKYGQYERNVMDVYLPANRTDKTPLAILIHGGAWTMAGKEYIRDYQDFLFDHGIAVVSINHRYANNKDVHYQQMLQDIDQAVSYCRNHAKEWNIRNKGIVMTGVSSGAHLALLYAYTTSNKVNAIVEFSGPVNLADTATLNYSAKVGLIDVIQKMAGKVYNPGQPPPPEYTASSPVDHIKNIPVLIVHGTADVIVKFSQSQQLNDTLKAKNIPHKLIPIPGAGHALDSKEVATKIYNEAVAWIMQYGE